MFKHILVPLDGSQLAESVLPMTIEICKKMDAEITLLHIIEKDAPQEIHGQHHLTNEQEACTYLDKIAERWFPDISNLPEHVHSEEVSRVAQSIVQHSAEFSPDLIILSAHGEGGLRDIVAGGIAQQVIANGQVPVLLIQPGESGGVEFNGFKKLLVPLDGDEEHEQALETAIEMGSAFQAELHLVRVVPTYSTLSGTQAAAGTLMPSAASAFLEMEEDEVIEYLGEKVAWVEKNKVQCSAEVRRGDPAAEVVKSAQEFHVDLILLGTHGKAGMTAFWAGSTAPRIVGKTTLPILLLPVRRR